MRVEVLFDPPLEHVADQIERAAEKAFAELLASAGSIIEGILEPLQDILWERHISEIPLGVEGHSLRIRKWKADTGYLEKVTAGGGRKKVIKWQETGTWTFTLGEFLWGMRRQEPFTPPRLEKRGNEIVYKFGINLDAFYVQYPKLFAMYMEERGVIHPNSIAGMIFYHKEQNTKILNRLSDAYWIKFRNCLRFRRNLVN